MLEVRHITKKYGSLTALRDFSFSFEQGDIVGFIGPNGAGKSTAMKIITGCFAPDEGSVIINGFDVLTQPVDAKKNIGYLPEQPPLYQKFTVTEYLNTLFDIKQLKVNKKTRVSEVIELTGLEKAAKRKIGNLSHGYCQRVGLAQAILSYPPFLVLDEPTSGLDPAQKLDMLALVKELSKNSGIILSSHILSEIDSVCNKILMINKGRLAGFDDKDKIGETNIPGVQKFVFKYIVSGEKRAVSDAVSGISGVVDITSVQKGENTECIITARDDVRDKIFMSLLRHKLSIVSFSVVNNDLENTFLNMLGNGEKNNKKRKSAEG